MKVIVAGATGLVGRQLLERCISSSEITHIYALSRKLYYGIGVDEVARAVISIAMNGFEERIK
jgi:NAD dependent epimerase/dehydratase family enzyme